jgi:hypothetical protein
MTVIMAKILDATHLELSQPLPTPLGKTIAITITDEEQEEHLWQEASMKHFLDAYDDQDAIYDQL